MKLEIPKVPWEIKWEKMKHVLGSDQDAQANASLTSLYESKGTRIIYQGGGDFPWKMLLVGGNMKVNYS